MNINQVSVICCWHSITDKRLFHTHTSLESWAVDQMPMKAPEKIIKDLELSVTREYSCSLYPTCWRSVGGATMINTVVFFVVILLLLISSLSEECAGFPWRADCSSLQFSVAPGICVSMGLHCVLPKRLWHRKLSIFCSILKLGLTVSGWQPCSQTQQHLTVSVSWRQRVKQPGEV